MSARPSFIPGLQLGRLFYEEARAIVEKIVPTDAYAAALMGYGSEVLGFDSERSVDHNWGPRFQLFLEPSLPEARMRALSQALRDQLPKTFRGHAVELPDADPQVSQPHLLEITTTREFFQRYLGMDIFGGIGALDWLTFPEQRLLELTSGEVFHDPTGELARLRGTLSSWPRDVWLYRMACQWQKLFQEEAVVGRCAEAGDALGMRVVTARIVRDLMRLFFLMEHRYAPYDKWLGTAFARLPCGPLVMPLLSAALDARRYPRIEARLAALYRNAAEMHNALAVTEPLDPTPRPFFPPFHTLPRRGAQPDRGGIGRL